MTPPGMTYQRVATDVMEAQGEVQSRGSIRVSLPWNVTPEQVAAFLPAYARMAERLRATQVSLPSGPL